MIRIVVDTSVFLRYLLKPGAATRRLIEELWLGDQVQIVTAPELVGELEAVLGRPALRALIGPDEGQALLDAICRRARMLEPIGSPPVYTRDRKDDKFVACALAGEAEYLVSEDRDILALGTLGGVEMVTPYALVQAIDRA